MGNRREDDDGLRCRPDLARHPSFADVACGCYAGLANDSLHEGNFNEEIYFMCIKEGDLRTLGMGFVPSTNS